MVYAALLKWKESYDLSFADGVLVHGPSERDV
jgi:hypothetical protein